MGFISNESLVSEPLQCCSGLIHSLVLPGFPLVPSAGAKSSFFSQLLLLGDLLGEKDGAETTEFASPFARG